jgi:hypothetical protein
MITLQFIVCPNPKCKEFTLKEWMFEYEKPVGYPSRTGSNLQSWCLVPPSTAKVFPDYVPSPILQDYREACLIQNLSPKASATLSRRCLQGMIRDFWKIKKDRLVDEIEALEKHVDPLTWEAIDAVRKVGNIGAHMKKDIDVIVDVDPLEAEKLIGLIELLISDWYVTRYERQRRLEEIVAIGEAKAKPKDSATAE